MSSSPWAHGGEANVAYFAGGCFWCTEAVFRRVPGMTSVASGYMQGAETIQITFDPTKTRYEKLLNMFWRAHNPTEVDSQGRTLEGSIALPSFTSMNSNAQPQRNRRRRRKNRTQNRSQLRSRERDHFVPRLRIIRIFVGKTRTIRMCGK